jgi:hypothetical protein
MYFFPHKNMVKATKKGNNLLVECIDWINATSLILKEKQVQTKTIYWRNN